MKLKINASSFVCGDSNYFDLDEIEFCDSVNYVALETTPESLIKHIDRIHISSKYIYIFDKSRSRLFQFTLAGQFVKQIGSVGKGPDEHSKIMDFSISRATGNVLMLCEYQFVELDTEGHIQKRLKLPDVFHSFILVENSLWLFSYDDSYCATLFDYDSGEVIKKEISKHFPELKHKIHLQRNVSYGPVPFFVDFWDDNVYSFTKDDVEQVRSIDFGSHSVPKSVVRKLGRQSDFISYLNKNCYWYHISNFVESNNFIFFRAEPQVFVLFDKSTNKFYVANFFKDSTTGLSLSNLVSAGNRSAVCLTNIVQPNILLMSKKYIQSYASDSCFLKIVNSIEEGDNPILMNYWLR
ncbi:6-bladed beta-propeller [Geofilum sp. OHC36d9]|uniref:6-bladed beta-propeller n=1 Tax=Geofilum sp. OHC36d9 TaxID=3458413 RepID=UPI004033E5B1